MPVTEIDEETNALQLDFNNVVTLNDVLKIIQDTDISTFIDSVTFDVKSQTFIFRIQKLLKEEAESLDRQRASEDDTAITKIIKLSESYKDKYPELLDYFKDWKPLREKLVSLLRTSSSNLERSSTLVSGFRILTSAADIFGTLARCSGKPEHSWSDFAMENASSFGVIALFLEMTYSKKVHNDVKKAIKKDQEIFKKISKWFKQTEELDATIKSFFPYGIDTDIVKKINNCSSDFDDYNKMFMSIVASNVKRNVKLFKNKKFLDKADRVATSEAGKQWFHKVILENDPYFQQCFNSNLCEEIQQALKVSPTENREIYVEACRALSSKVRMKVTVNAITIISSVSNILFGSKSDSCDHFEKLSETSTKELEEIQTVVRLIKPSDMELDPILTNL